MFCSLIFSIYILKADRKHLTSFFQIKYYFKHTFACESELKLKYSLYVFSPLHFFPLSVQDAVKFPFTVTKHLRVFFLSSLYPHTTETSFPGIFYWYKYVSK